MEKVMHKTMYGDNLCWTDGDNFVSLNRQPDEKAAEKCLTSLKNCKNCYNCNDCFNCEDCTCCDDCNNCIKCDSCYHCSGCNEFQDVEYAVQD